MKRCLSLIVLFTALLCAFPTAADAEYRVVVADENMIVISSQFQAVAREGEALRLLISPYEYEQKRIAVLIGDDGEVKYSFIAVDTPHSLGSEDELFDLIYPEIRIDAYERAHEYYDELGGLTGDLWYYLEKEITITRRERLKIIDFVNWEEEREMEADSARLTHVRLPDSGLNLFLIYVTDSGE